VLRSTTKANDFFLKQWFCLCSYNRKAHNLSKFFAFYSVKGKANKITDEWFRPSAPK